jgi:cation transport regulator ChaC
MGNYMYYFAYGSNMDRKRMEERGVEYKSVQPAVLEDFALAFDKIANGKYGYANIKVCPEGIVEGVLYDIDYDGLRILDLYEGFPNHYRRYYIKVELQDGRSVKAFTYIANRNMTKMGLIPTKEYLSHLLAGKKFLSKPYYKRLAKQ